MNNMEKKDKIVVDINGKQSEIYPLMELEYNNRKYIIYTDTNNHNEIENNIYIGVLTGESILPVNKDELGYFDEVVGKIINSVKNNIAY